MELLLPYDVLTHYVSYRLIPNKFYLFLSLIHYTIYKFGREITLYNCRHDKLGILLLFGSAFLLIGLISLKKSGQIYLLCIGQMMEKQYMIKTVSKFI